MNGCLFQFLHVKLIHIHTKRHNGKSESIMDSTATNATYSCNYFMRNIFIGECSGNGVCVNEKPNEWVADGVMGKCICNEGFSGNGDFMDATGMDCSVNHTVVANWWLVLGVLYSGLFVYCTVITIGFVRKQKKEHFNAIMKSPMQKSILYVAIECLFRMTESIIRVSSGGTAVIGSGSLAITLIEAFAGMLFWASLGPGFMTTWMNTVMSNAKMSGAQGLTVKTRMENMQKQLKVFKWGVAFVFLTTIGTYFTPDPDIAKYFIITYYLGMSIASVYLVNVCALPVARLFADILKESNKSGTDAKMNMLQDKVAVFTREIRNNGISNTLSCLAFVCLPFLWTFISYQVLFGWSIAIPILFAAAVFIKPPSANRSTSRRRSFFSGGKAKVSPSAAEPRVIAEV